MLKLSNLFFVVLVIQIQIHFCAADGDLGCPGKAWEDSTKTDSHCYVTTDQKYTYYKAQEYCEEIGGNLASIHTPEENTIVKNSCKDIYGSDLFSCWIGMFKNDSGSWVWSDGTPDNFQNWFNDKAKENDVCSYIEYYDDFWQHSDDPDTPSFGICKRPVSSPATTPSPQTTGGCIDFIREGCPEPDASTQFVHFPQGNAGQCQRVCLTNDICNSFLFDNDAKECYLYTSDVGGLSKCHDVGGPRNPSMETCEANRCQNYFQSSCDGEGLLIVASKEGISKLTDCEKQCILNSECKQWEIVNVSTCNLYSGLKACKTVRGPKRPEFDDCSSLTSNRT